MTEVTELVMTDEWRLTVFSVIHEHHQHLNYILHSDSDFQDVDIVDTTLHFYTCLQRFESLDLNKSYCTPL